MKYTILNAFFFIFCTGIAMLNAKVPLFSNYPPLQEKLPYINLGIYPTPLFKADNLGKTLEIHNLYIKDDGYSDNLKIPTGNKMRKLEWLLADAQKKGFKTVCTVGSAGSNHALETAICAQQAGLQTVLILDDQCNTGVVARNLKLMVYFGAKIIYALPCYAQSNESLEQYAQEICNQNNYYFIPVGGSNTVGSLGYVNAVLELKQQLKDMNIDDPDVIYITLGSAGTAAGIIVGAMAAELKSKIIPVRISFTAEYKTEVLQRLVNETIEFLHEQDSSFNCEKATLNGTQIVVPGLTIEINHDHTGQGYASITKEASEAISLLNSSQGIKLDPTYTGKTLSALVHDAMQGKLRNKTVLFWNTFSYGSFEDLISQISYEKACANLPPELIHYLTDPLQDGDLGI